MQKQLGKPMLFNDMTIFSKENLLSISDILTAKVKYIYSKECEKISDKEKELFKLGTFNMKKIYG